MSRRINRREHDYNDDVPEQLQEKNQYPIDFDEELLPEFEVLEDEDQKQYEQRIEQGEEEVKPKSRPRVKKVVESTMPQESQQDNVFKFDEDHNTENESKTKISSSELLAGMLKKVKSKVKTETKAQHQKEDLVPLTWEQVWKKWIFSVYTIYLGLFLAVLCNALFVIHQTYIYRVDYQKFNRLKERTQQLDTEWGRLLIEKQTFGSSGQIATRATMQMGMFSPSTQQRIVMNVPQLKIAEGQADE